MSHLILLLAGGGGGALLIGGSVWAYLHTHHHTDQDNEKTSLKHNLKNEQMKAQIIFNAIQDGVMIISQTHIIEAFNPGASNITGWKIEEALGIDFKLVVRLVDNQGNPYPDAENPFLSSLSNHLAVRDSNATILTRGDHRIPISLEVSPVTNESGAPTGQVVAVFRDVSKEKAEEKQRGEFISTASHEMRTPIAAIEGYLSLALNEKVCKIDPNAKNYLEKAHAATSHLGRLFQDLLTSSKAEDGRLQSYPTVIEMGELVQQTVDDGRFNAEKKGLQLKYVFSNDQPAKSLRPLFYVFADQNRMREVLQNLIDNAIKYTNDGTVTISLTGDDNVMQLQFNDTGPGIAPEDIGHLFQKFYRVDSTLTRTVTGTGLGLFICRKIVEMYNGRIWVESQLGKGSTFFINLPRLNAEKALKVQHEQASHMSVLDTGS